MKPVILLMFSVLTITACQNTSISSFDGDALDVLENSTWRWAGENSCQSYVQSIEKDGDQLVFTWTEASTGKFGSKAVYDINESHGAYFMLTLLPEQGSSEVPVDWDLVVKSDHQYCWRKSDWFFMQCTKPMIKCK